MVFPVVKGILPVSIKEQEVLITLGSRDFCRLKLLDGIFLVKGRSGMIVGSIAPVSERGTNPNDKVEILVSPMRLRGKLVAIDVLV